MKMGNFGKHISFNHKSLPFYISAAFLVCSVTVILVTILRYNAGHFIYTLDDPYIHLSLAQNIWKGHYGINAIEFSAPSSSILWPFILAPFSNNVYSPLIINICAAIATTFLLAKIIQTKVHNHNAITTLLVAALFILFQLSTNMMGLIFTGMEHSLQVFLVTLIAYGLIMEIENQTAPLWLWSTIILSPLIRYECLTISVPALIFLLINKYYKETVLSTITLMACIGSFSLFLSSMGLGLISSSILVKSSVVRSHGAFHHILLNLYSSLFEQRQGIMLLTIATSLMAHHIFARCSKKKLLSSVTVLAILGHFVAGRYSSYHRYEIYILVFSLLISLYLWLPAIVRLLSTGRKPQTLLAASTICIFVFAIGQPYITDLPTIPIASNNIYEQQYQMHRFATEYYKLPVAVNDLGYVSYDNKNYVLDLWGLGSKMALTDRMYNSHLDWIKGLCERHGVKLIMIYDSWFQNNPSDSFIKLGELHLSKPAITPACSFVSFYAADKNSKKEITQKLQRFIKTLPPGVKFTFEKSIG